MDLQLGGLFGMKRQAFLTGIEVDISIFGTNLHQRGR